MDTLGIKAVQVMQDYIKENLDKTITLSDLAKAANYSQSHASRIFKEMTGKSPFEYIRAYRLTQAARELRSGHVKIVDVAFDYIFDTHEGFTRAFTKAFGMSPRSYKQKPVPVKYFMPYNVKTRYNLKRSEDMEKKEKTSIIFTQVIERPKRLAIIKRGVNAKDYFEYCEEVGCDLWGIFNSVAEAMYESAGFWLPKKLIKSGTSKYVMGVEVPQNYSNKIPEGCELIDLDPCMVMVFQGEPFEEENFEQAISEVWEAADKFDPKIYGYEWSDEAPRFQLAPQGYRGYIEGRPVKKISK